MKSFKLVANDDGNREPLEFGLVLLQDLREPQLRFSSAFQDYLSGELTRLVPRSPEFFRRYGPGWGVTIFLMAKRGIDRADVKGPVRVPKLKTVELFLTLPGDQIPSDGPWRVPVSKLLLAGIGEVLAKARLDGAQFLAAENRIAHRIQSDPEMETAEPPDGPLPPFPWSVTGKPKT